MGTATTSHFVFRGVSSFQSVYTGYIGLSANGIQLAEYDTGLPGVLTVADDSVMFVNGFPADAGDYLNGSDFGLVFANALAPVPEPSCLGLMILAMTGLFGCIRPTRRLPLS